MELYRTHDVLEMEPDGEPAGMGKAIMKGILALKLFTDWIL